MAKKKKSIVLARNEKIAEQGLELDGKKYEFHQGKALWGEDQGIAEALQQKYPRDIAVTEDQQYSWSVNNDNGNGTTMDNIHHYTFQGVDTSHLKTKRDNGYVWVSVGVGKQARMKREVALAEGYEIIPQKRSVRAVEKRREVE